MPLGPVGATHLDADPVLGLRNADHLVRKQHLDIGQFLKTLKKKFCCFKLLTLDDERVAGVVLQKDMIELGDLVATWSIPELKDGRYQTDASHLVCKTIFGEQIERGRMRRRRPRIRLRRIIEVEEPDRKTATPKQPSA